jgi:hypothetical protein
MNAPLAIADLLAAGQLFHVYRLALVVFALAYTALAVARVISALRAGLRTDARAERLAWRYGLTNVLGLRIRLHARALLEVFVLSLILLTLIAVQL